MRFYHLTDTHYLSKSYFEDINCPEVIDQIQRKLSSDMLRATLKQIAEDTETEYVFLSGDITNNGEVESHRELVELLNDFVNTSGKKLYLITAGHDYDPHVDRLWIPKGIPNAERFRGKKIAKRYDREGKPVYDVETVPRTYLRENYSCFGYDQAVEQEPNSMSYAVDFPDNIRVLMLNDDCVEPVSPHDKMPTAGYSKTLMDFVTRVTADAKSRGMHVFAFSHHPVITPNNIYSVISKRDMSDNTDKQIDKLCDMGIPVMFTGHTHMHSNAFMTTEKGNVMYNVGTAALSGCPPFYRLVDYNPETETMDIRTLVVPNPEGVDLRGMDLLQYTEENFFGFIQKIAVSMGNDVPTFALLAVGMSINPRKVMKHRVAVKAVGKFINHLTYKKIWRWTKKETGLKREDIADIQDQKVVDFIMRVAQKIYVGDPDVDANSKEYILAMGVIAVLDSIVRCLPIKVDKLLGQPTLTEFADPLFRSAGIPDAEATLHLYEKPQLPPAPPRLTSHKGGAIIAAIVLAVIITLPVTIPITLIVLLVKLLTKPFKKEHSFMPMPPAPKAKS